MMKPDLDRDHIPTPEAQKRTGLSKSYLALMLRKGPLEGFRMGRDWFIYTDSLEHFLAQERKPRPKGPRKKPSRSQVQNRPDMSSADVHQENGSEKS